MTRRLRELAGLPRVTLKEEMAQARFEGGTWTDGEYTHGDSITMNGIGWNIEFEPDPASLKATGDTGVPVEGAWYAINDQGEEVEFIPGEEDEHFPSKKAAQPFPESNQRITEDMDEIAFRKLIARIHKMAERLEFLAKPHSPLAKRIDALGGDTSALHLLRDAAEDVYRASDEIEYHALAHRSQN